MERFKIFTDSDTCIDFQSRETQARNHMKHRLDDGDCPVLVVECGSEFYAETVLCGEPVEQRFTNERDLLLWIGMHHF